MGIRVNTNVQSLSAQRALSASNQQQKNTLDHLSSGSRITKSADDAAGLAISENMRGQIRSVRQNNRNANDAVSMVQVAEGGMNEVANILVRFRELSIQAASDTISDNERSFIDKEVQQLASEVDRIANATEFNGRKLLNGTGESLDIQVGQFNDEKYDRISWNTENTNVTGESLGVSGMTVKSKEEAQENLGKIDNAIKKLSENRSDLGALQNRFQSTINNLQIYEENLSAAKSRISDADIAHETAELTKSNILTNAGASVLSQANQNTMIALKLIG